MLEALIVYGVTLLLLFMILAIFSVMYQNWNVQTIANESATRIAQTYKFSNANVVTGEVEMSDLKDIDPYRYMFGNDDTETAAKLKVKPYVLDRLSRTTFTQSVGNIDVFADVEPDGLGRRHLVVTIMGKYKVPFGEVLDYLGLAGSTTYSVTAYAECLDLSDYLSTTCFVANNAGLGAAGSKTVGAVDSVLKLIDTIINKG